MKNIPFTSRKLLEQKALKHFAFEKQKPEKQYSLNLCFGITTDCLQENQTHPKDRAFCAGSHIPETNKTIGLTKLKEHYQTNNSIYTGPV